MHAKSCCLWEGKLTWGNQAKCAQLCHWKPKWPFERLMGHLALCVLTREMEKSFSGGDSRGGGCSCRMAPAYIFSSILAFFFPTVSHHPASLASSSHFFLGVWPPPNDFCLSFHVPCHLTFCLFTLIRSGGWEGTLYGGETWVLEYSLAFSSTLLLFKFIY